MPWFTVISNYSESSSGRTNHVLNEDLDQDVVKQTLEKALLPRVLGVLLHVWNPFSVLQTSNAAALVNQLCNIFNSFSSHANSNNLNNDNKTSETVSEQLYSVLVLRIEEALELQPLKVTFASNEEKQQLLNSPTKNPIELLQRWQSFFPQ